MATIGSFGVSASKCLWGHRGHDHGHLHGHRGHLHGHQGHDHGHYGLLQGHEDVLEGHPPAITVKLHCRSRTREAVRRREHAFNCPQKTASKGLAIFEKRGISRVKGRRRTGHFYGAQRSEKP